MNKILLSFLALNIVFLSAPAFAGDDSGPSANVPKVDAQVKDVTGGNKMDQEAIYKLASQILGEVKGNDPNALKQALANAQKDPQKFLETLTPELQKQIRELAGRIEDRQK